ncbi:unnamed protein product [Rhizophagus irregularis]|nr:unnamed protein product [Rhizophagus irregularis]CAB5321789.1 unnamed protein product [Rhizophagus irregularis]
MNKFILILVLAVVAFSTIASATPTNWKRGGTFRGATIPKGKSSLESLIERQLQCDLGYFQCPNGYGCCPDDSSCINDHQCNIPCTTSDTPCGDGCCFSTEVCTIGPNNLPLCYSSY